MEQSERQKLDQYITGNYGEDSVAEDNETIRIAPRVHHYHHYEPSQPTVSVKCERNTKGFNWEVSVSGADSVEEAMALMDKTRNEMEHRFGTVQVVQ